MPCWRRELSSSTRRPASSISPMANWRSWAPTSFTRLGFWDRPERAVAAADHRGDGADQRAVRRCHLCCPDAPSGGPADLRGRHGDDRSGDHSQGRHCRDLAVAQRRHQPSAGRRCCPSQVAAGSPDRRRHRRLPASLFFAALFVFFQSYPPRAPVSRSGGKSAARQPAAGQRQSYSGAGVGHGGVLRLARRRSVRLTIDAQPAEHRSSA